MDDERHGVKMTSVPRRARSIAIAGQRIDGFFLSDFRLGPRMRCEYVKLCVVGLYDRGVWVRSGRSKRGK